jgi:hypothetical protein
MRNPSGKPKFKRNWGKNRPSIPRKKGDKKVLDGLQELVDAKFRRNKRVAALLPDQNGMLDLTTGLMVKARSEAERLAGLAALARFTLTAPLAAGAPFAVPSYIVGRNKLLVYWNGVYCACGAGNTFQYNVSGAAGANSTSITFHFALGAGDVIDVIVLP